MNYDRFHSLPTLAELGVDFEEKYDSGENEVWIHFYNFLKSSQLQLYCYLVDSF